MHILHALQGKDLMSFKTPRLLRQITYKEKTPSAMTWSQFTSELLIIQQVFDKLFFPTGEVGLELATCVRSFLTSAPLPKILPSSPTLDPKLFQSLDRAFTAGKWLPSVLTIRAYHHYGFPSDHFPVEMTLRVKLAQQSRCPRPKRSLAYPNNENDPRLLEFHQSFRTYFNPQPLPRPCAVTESLTVFTDGSVGMDEYT